MLQGYHDLFDFSVLPSISIYLYIRALLLNILIIHLLLQIECLEKKMASVSNLIRTKILTITIIWKVQCVLLIFTKYFFKRFLCQSSQAQGDKGQVNTALCHCAAYCSVKSGIFIVIFMLFTLTVTRCCRNVIIVMWFIKQKRMPL